MTSRADAFKPEFIRDYSWKYPVRVATTAAGTLASSFENGDSVDGVTLATGDRILIKDQATGSQNGIYVVAASGTPARAYDMDTGLETLGSIVYVIAGTVNGGTLWKNTNTSTVTVGSTALTFAQVGAAAAALLTTKGDLHAYSTTDIRFAVGSDGQSLTAASGQTAGLTWMTHEVLMVDGITSPPEPMTTEDGTDWLYEG